MARSKARRALGSWRAHWNASSIELVCEQAGRPAGAVTGAGAAEQPAAVSRHISRRAGFPWKLIRPLSGQEKVLLVSTESKAPAPQRQLVVSQAREAEAVL